jgi:hypothetical protein
MLFCLDESILKVLKDERVKDALSNLAMARKKGKHLIYGTREVLDALGQSVELDKRQKDVFIKLSSKSSKLKAYLNEFDRRVELVGNNDIISKYIDGNGKQVIQVPIHLLEELNLVTESMLILEDINDYKMYKYIAEYVLYRRNLTDVKFSFNIIPGSGGGIKKVFEEKIQGNKNLVISIADTDKICPDQGLHDTIRPLVKFHKSIKDTCLGEVFYSEYHEVENLVPQFCYEQLVGLTKNEIESYLEVATTSTKTNKLGIPIDWRTFQLNIYRVNREDVFKYFDYKEGIRLTNFRCIHGEKFWSKLLSDLGSDFSISNFAIIDKENKNTKIINGFNDKVLNNTFEILSETDLSVLDKLLTQELQYLWTCIGNFLLDWGCGGIPMRVV